MVPDRAGADTRVDVTIPLSDLLGMDGASLVEDTWLRARAGEHGYMSGKDAEAVSCDAMIVPVVTGSPDWDLITEMITLITDAHGHAPAGPGAPAPNGRPAQPEDPGPGPPPPGPRPGPQPLPPKRGRPCSTPSPAAPSGSSPAPAPSPPPSAAICLISP